MAETKNAEEDRSAMGLVAQIVKSNVDQAAATHDSIVAFHQGREARLAEALIQLVNAIDECQIIDRRLLGVLNRDSITSAYVTAERIVSEGSQ